jgi:ribosome-binding factor A
MDVRRILRVSEAVKEELNEIIGFEMEDPRLLEVEVTDVQVSPDSRHAVVKVSLRGDQKRQKHALAALEHATGNWPCAYSSGRFRNCVLNRTRILTWKAVWTFSYGG